MDVELLVLPLTLVNVISYPAFDPEWLEGDGWTYRFFSAVGLSMPAKMLSSLPSSSSVERP